MTSEEFSRLPLKKKLPLVEQHGDFVAQRIHQSYNIQLFTLNGFYVEVWKQLGLNYLHWIEVVNDHSILNQYTGDIDLKGLFD